MTKEKILSVFEDINVMYNNPNMYDGLSKMLDELVEDSKKSVEPDRKKGKWISVSERLPETNDDVLVYDGVDMFVAWYSWEGMGQGWNSSDNNFDRYTSIIAWMPLPEPMEAESEEV